MSFIFNSNFVVIGNPNSEPEVLLKNISSNRVFKMSNIEYLIIKKFSENNSIEATHDEFRNDFQLDKDVIETVVNVSKKNEFLLDSSDESGVLEKDYASSGLTYAMYSAFAFITGKKSRLKLELKGNFNLIKLFSWKPKSVSRYIKNNFIYIQYSALMLSVSFMLFNLSSIDFLYLFYSIGQISTVYLIAIALPLALFVSLAHEYSHYITYKFLGGTQSEMGLALMYRFLPIFYTSTEDMILWKGKKRKILVASSGLLNDIIFLTALLGSYSYLPEGIPSAISGFVILGLFIKMVYNANPFAPGSDMYFISCDIFGLNSPFLKAHDSLKAFFKRNKEERKNLKFGDLIYSILCYVSIFSYSVFIIILLTFPFWISRVV